MTVFRTGVIAFHDRSNEPDAAGAGVYGSEAGCQRSRLSHAINQCPLSGVHDTSYSADLDNAIRIGLQGLIQSAA